MAESLSSSTLRTWQPFAWLVAKFHHSARTNLPPQRHPALQNMTNWTYWYNQNHTYGPGHHAGGNYPVFFRQTSYSGQNTTVAPYYSFFADPSLQPIRHLITGATYTFHYNSSDAGHPFWIGSYAHQSSDTRPGMGVLSKSSPAKFRYSGISPGETLTLTLDGNFKGEIFYYCTQHATMLASIRADQLGIHMASKRYVECLLRFLLRTSKSNIWSSVLSQLLSLLQQLKQLQRISKYPYDYSSSSSYDPSSSSSYDPASSSSSYDPSSSSSYDPKQQLII